MGNYWSQIFPPSPVLTEHNLPDQSGKACQTCKAIEDANLSSKQVFLITGGNAGIGAKLANILYMHNATVYIAARNEEKAIKVIEASKNESPDSKGKMIFLSIHLEDLTTIKPAVVEFLTREKRLDVLINNAGVLKMGTTKQNYDLQLGVNCLAHCLLTQFLRPILTYTAEINAEKESRVVWVVSLALNQLAPKGGVAISMLKPSIPGSVYTKYAISKAGVYLRSNEFAKRVKDENVICVTLDPENLTTGLQANLPMVDRKLLRLITHDPKYGAYTELFAGFGTSVTAATTHRLIMPWGRLGEARKDIVLATMSREDGGTGRGKEFWEWVDDQIKPFWS